MGKQILYMNAVIPSSRAVLLTEKALGLNLEHKTLKTFAGETRTPEFTKLNPQQTIPTLDDNGDVIVDGHAISAYLVSKYGGEKYASLLPTEPLARAHVDHRLHFNNSVLYIRSGKIIEPLLRGDEKEINKDNLDSFNKALDVLEAFLVDDYVAGKNLTIADFSIISAIPLVIMLTKNDLSKLPRIAAWIKRLEQLPYYHDIITKNDLILAERMGGLKP